jgi:ribonuclease HII
VSVPARQIGIDENGLGPRLGPMIVTAVRLELDPQRVPDARVYAELATRAGIGDSKAACAHGSMRGVEGRVLALLREHLGLEADSLATLTTALALEDAVALRQHCPSGEAPAACFGDPVPLPAFGAGPTEQDRAAAVALREAGVRLCGVRVGIACAKRMNLGREAGASRFDLDLAFMVRLAASLQPAGAAPVVALCGKVGGRKSYAAALQPLSPLVGVVAEERTRSSYQLPGFGEAHFVMDGDATEPAIGLASLVGKYVRELWMHRLNRYWMAAVPGVTPVSGYHDPVTERFVQATALARRERAVPDACFER